MRAIDPAPVHGGAERARATEPVLLKCMLFANTDWNLYNFKHLLAIALGEQGHEILLVSPP
jgi:hypothetical protein